MTTQRLLRRLAIAIALLVQTTTAVAPTAKVLPNAYIIELEATASTLSGRSAGSIHTRFHRRAQEADLNYQLRHEFTDESLFHGLSINLQNDDDVSAVRNLPEVKRLWPVVEFPAPFPENKPTTAENQTRSALPATFAARGSLPKVIRSDNFTMDHNLRTTGVDKLHSRGYRGKGIKVAVIDSGVDYYHPALGGGLGPGMKIASGRNYVDNSTDPNDPLATCENGGHGTSVAGIIVGEDPKGTGFGLIGVAPDATLSMYRVSRCGENSDSETVLKAMMDAYNDGADVVSISIGLPSGFDVLTPFDQVIAAAKKRNIATIIAAGNFGATGPIAMGDMAVTKDAVAVACSDSSKYPTTYKVKSSRGDEWTYSGLWPLEGDFHVYTSEDYEESLGCDLQLQFKALDEIEARGWNYSDTIYMARRSTNCTIGAIAPQMERVGIAGVIYWQEEEYANPYDNNYPDAQALGMNHIDGRQLYEAVLEDPLEFRLSFTDRRFRSVENPSGGFTSNYSAFGNTWEYNVFKPLLSAPGHLSLSTWPLEAGGYDIVSGTSIATPFVAGCYAVLKQALPDLSVDEITDLLTTTAIPSKWWGNKDIVNTISQQGAGTIDVWKAYKSSVKFTEGTLLLGQTAKPVAKNITFTNTGLLSETFEISHVPAGLSQRVPYEDIALIENAKFGFPSKAVYADVEFTSPTKVTLEPGESHTIEFIVTPPDGIDPDTIPQYSGHIQLISSKEDIYNVAYQGMPYDLRNTPTLERDILPGYPQLPAVAASIEGEVEFSDSDIVSANISAGEGFMMHYFRRQPAYAFRIDVVAANTTFEPTYAGFNTSRQVENLTIPEQPVRETFDGADSYGWVHDFEYLGPEYEEVGWYGNLQYGEESFQVVDGDYRMLVRVLPVGGNVNKTEDWESWLSPVLRISGMVSEDDDGGDGGDGDGDHGGDDGEDDGEGDGDDGEDDGEGDENEDEGEDDGEDDDGNDDGEGDDNKGSDDSYGNGGNNEDESGNDAVDENDNDAGNADDNGSGNNDRGDVGGNSGNNYGNANGNGNGVSSGDEYEHDVGNGIGKDNGGYIDSPGSGSGHGDSYGSGGTTETKYASPATSTSLVPCPSA